MYEFLCNFWNWTEEKNATEMLSNVLPFNSMNRPLCVHLCVGEKCRWQNWWLNLKLYQTHTIKKDFRCKKKQILIFGELLWKYICKLRLELFTLWYPTTSPTTVLKFKMFHSANILRRPCWYLQWISFIKITLLDEISWNIWIMPFWIWGIFLF